MTDLEFNIMISTPRQFPFILKEKQLQYNWRLLEMEPHVSEITLTELLAVKGVATFCDIVGQLIREQYDTFRGLEPINGYLRGMGEATAKAVLADYIESYVAHSIGTKKALRVKKLAFTARRREYIGAKDSALADSKDAIRGIEDAIVKYQAEEKAYAAMYTGQRNLLNGARKSLNTACELADSFISSKDGIIGLGVIGQSIPTDTETATVEATQDDIKFLRKSFFGTFDTMQKTAHDISVATFHHYDSRIEELREQAMQLVKQCYKLPEYNDVQNWYHFKTWAAPKEVIQDMRTAYEEAVSDRLKYVQNQDTTKRNSPKMI
jgi:hypothetical protein